MRVRVLSLFFSAWLFLPSAASSSKRLRHRRVQLFSSTFYEIELVLALFYVNNDAAKQVESLDEDNATASDLCSVVFEQVGTMLLRQNDLNVFLINLTL